MHAHGHRGHPARWTRPATSSSRRGRAGSRKRSRRASAYRSARASPDASRPRACRCTSPTSSRAEVVNPLLMKRGLKSLLGVPLLVEGRLLGVVHVGSDDAARLHERRRTDTAAPREPDRAGDRAVAALRERARGQPAARVPRRGERAARRDARLFGRPAGPDRARCPVSRRLVHRGHAPRRSGRAGGGRARRPGGPGRCLRVPEALPARSRCRARPRPRDRQRRGGADLRGDRRAPAARERRRPGVPRGAPRRRDDLADVGAADRPRPGAGGDHAALGAA